jgi:hypothetical protein
LKGFTEANLYFRIPAGLWRRRKRNAYVNAAIGQNIESKHIVGAFQKQFYYQWIDSILSGNPVLSAFNRISQGKVIRTFSEKDTEQFEINEAKIRAELSSMCPSLDMIASGSASVSSVSAAGAVWRSMPPPLTLALKRPLL